jgi:hypothetical protein
VAEATDFLKALGYYGYFFTQEGLQPITRFDPSVHQNEANIPRPPHYDQVGRTYFNNFLFCTPDRAHLLFEGAARLEKHPAH